MGHYGIGELTSVAILAELGDCRRFTSSRHAVRYVGLDITVYQSDQRRSPGRLSRQGPPTLRWALYEAAVVASRAGSPDRTSRRPSGSGTSAPACRSLASCSNAATTRSENSARQGCNPHDLHRVRHAPPQPMHRGQLPTTRCRHARRGRPAKTERPHRTSPSGNITPSPSCRRPTNARVVDQISMGARAHTPPTSTSTAPVKRFALGPPGRPTGDRAPPLALDHNEWSGASPGLVNDPHPRRA